MFDSYSLISEQPGAIVLDHITYYNQGNSGTYSLTEDNTIDLSALLSAGFGTGQLVSDLVRVSENTNGTAAFLQIEACSMARPSPSPRSSRGSKPAIA